MCLMDRSGQEFQIESKIGFYDGVEAEQHQKMIVESQRSKSW